jgi:hypothetical protein
MIAPLSCGVVRLARVARFMAAADELSDVARVWQSRAASDLGQVEQALSEP